MERKKILFIVNPISGGKNKDKIVDIIKKTIDTEKFIPEYIYTQKGGDAVDFAKNTSAEIVVAVGGDGTVNEVARGILGSSKVLGIVPCGSGDGMAFHLGISRNTVKAVKVLNDMHIQKADSGIVNDRPFFCTVGVGIDALTADKFANTKKRGLFNYIRLALSIWKNFKPETYTIDIDGIKRTEVAAIVTVANINQWGNKARIAPKASVTDGLLDLVNVSPFRTADIPLMATRLMLGKIDKSKKVIILKGKKIVIQRDTKGAVQTDGDPSNRADMIEVAVNPSSIAVLVPKEISI